VSDPITLEARLRRLEDIEEIRQLKARYCALADRGYEGAGNDDDGFAELFVDDGVFEASVGPIRGREAIRARCGHFQPFGLHLAVNPAIEVDGDTATAAWSALIPSTTADDRALLVAGRYEEELVRTASGWRYKHVRFVAAFRTPFEDGWSKTRFLANERRPAPGPHETTSTP
jgi:hypothetical protein